MILNHRDNLFISVVKIYATAQLTPSYPDAPDFLDQILNSVQGGNGNYLDEQLKSTLGDYYEPMMMVKNINSQPTLQARMPYHLIIK